MNTYYMSKMLKLLFPGHRRRTRIDNTFPKNPITPTMKINMPSNQNLAFCLNSLYSSMDS